MFVSCALLLLQSSDGCGTKFFNKKMDRRCGTFLVLYFLVVSPYVRGRKKSAFSRTSLPDERMDRERDRKMAMR